MGGLVPAPGKLDILGGRDQQDALGASQRRWRATVHLLRRLDVYVARMPVASPRNPARRRRPGEVRDAIERALAEAGGPLLVREICAAVAVRLGGGVPASSVRSYLNLNAGDGKPFERVRRGVCRVA